VTALVGGMGALSAGKQRKIAEEKERRAAARRMAIEANRQEPINPYEDLTNPYANIQIATRATEMQAEQADISLASSLDTLRATGASAGGATALARAAAQSKRGVAANIEKQEQTIAQLRAQGEMSTAQMRARGEMFKYNATQQREMEKLDREASLESSYNQQATAYQNQQNAAWGQTAGALATVGVGMGQQGAFGKGAQNFLTGNSMGRGAFMNTWGSEERGADARQAWRDINKNPDMLTAYNKSNQVGMNRNKFNLWQSEYWANNLDF
jgi:hypothetical protein